VQLSVGRVGLGKLNMHIVKRTIPLSYTATFEHSTDCTFKLGHLIVLHAVEAAESKN
jgi:hypothetical protein